MATKKETASKKINIKNKKEATKVLASKTPSKAKKAPAKKKTIVKKVTKAKTVLEKEPLVKSEENVVVTSEVKSKAKITSDKKEKVTKAEEKKTKTTKKTETPNIKRKITKKEKEPEKPKLIIPKEWQEINKNVKKEKETEVPTNKIKGKLRSSIFEEIDEQTYLLKKQKEKDNIKKTFLIILIIAVIIALGIYLFFKFNDNLRKQLEKYELFTIGTKVQLKDESIWYVVNDSKEHDETVKLLKATAIDINGDNKFNAKDGKKYNSKSESVYDPKNENSVGKYLNETYKKALEEKVGPIIEVSLLTSKEFVRIRDKMGFGYEWSKGNWLANSSLGNWWVISSPREDSVYVVTSTGAYKLAFANVAYYVRPTIVIRKALVTKLEEPNSNKKSALDIVTEKAKNLFKNTK